MFYLVSTLTVADVDAFIEGAGSAPQEFLDEWGIIENNIYRGVDQNIAIIVNAYKTLEEAQKHKAELETPQSKAAHEEQMGVKSYDIWIVERRVAR